MILIVDDDKMIRASLRLLLERAGYEVKLAADAEEALAAVRSGHLTLVIADMNFSQRTSGQEGLELLRKIKVLRPELPVILITAWGSISLAVEGMRLGAFDFITKPWDNHMLLSRIKTALELNVKSIEAESGEEAIDFDRCGIIGQSAQIQEILRTVRRIAPTEAAVLITGENGTGKELIAAALHANSLRKDGPFVKVNLGGISHSLFESEMFGSVKGAYTSSVESRKGRFEMAHKGTIFLDEIGELDAASQVKMLRVLQEHTFERLGESTPRKVDIRVISATNANLPEMVREHKFREDLYYRINLIGIHLPPLRERPSDIPLLVNHFAREINPRVKFASCAMDILRKLPYPGNIRELKNLVESTILMADGTEIGTPELKDRLHAHTSVRPVDHLSAVEEDIVREALNKSNGNVAHAAAMLGVTRQTLYRRMAKYGMK